MEPPPDDRAGPASPKPALQPPDDTPSLFQPRARRRGPATSREAAERIKGHAPEQRAKVFACIAEAGAEGRTADEVGELLELRPQSCSARVNELVRLGVVRDNGQRRPTSSGRSARVLVAATFPVESGAVQG
ncbi:MAG: hypothetical protein ACIAS6_03990 [Phycisphaerales bacterium JB060]